MIVRSIKDICKFILEYSEFEEILLTIKTTKNMQLIIQNKIDNCILYFFDKKFCITVIDNISLFEEQYKNIEELKDVFIIGFRKDKIDKLFLKLNSKVTHRLLHKYNRDFSINIKSFRPYTVASIDESTIGYNNFSNYIYYKDSYDIWHVHEKLNNYNYYNY